MNSENKRGSYQSIYWGEMWVKFRAQHAVPLPLNCMQQWRRLMKKKSHELTFLLPSFSFSSFSWSSWKSHICYKKIKDYYDLTLKNHLLITETKPTTMKHWHERASGTQGSSNWVLERLWCLMCHLYFPTLVLSRHCSSWPGTIASNWTKKSAGLKFDGHM